MCGICFSLHDQSETTGIDYDKLNARGPDLNSQMEPFRVTERLYATLAVSVLALRGAKQKSQPFIDEFGNILLYNGEIYRAPFSISVDENDGEKLSEYLKICVSTEEIRHCFSRLEGCFAFVYYQKERNSFYFGRDRLGRRSLLSSNFESKKSPFIVCSVRVANSSFVELNANELYHLTFRPSSDEFDIESFPYEPIPIDRFVSEEPEVLLTEFETESIYQNLSQQFLAELQSAVQRRLVNLPNFCRRCKKIDHETLRAQSDCEHAKLAILFSGGIDSTVLTVLADRVLPENQPIDLLNVAFHSGAQTTAADRQTGLQALTELNPNRQWNFVQIDVHIDELKKYREEIIKDVIYPCSTVLDDSIGSALWFAARGKGILYGEQTPYDSNAEVLLSGLGADEQLAGYSRHRMTFRNSGWAGLSRELEMEMNRISKRNLGRDDRVISSLGKEVRFPFLDEQFVRFLQSVPVWYKADLRLERGIGEKYLLRHVARNQLNLRRSSTYLKRAIQFGSRIAKLENRKEKASDHCSRLTTKSNPFDEVDED